jgi:hypothetical protein
VKTARKNVSVKAKLHVQVTMEFVKVNAGRVTMGFIVTKVSLVKA